MNSFVFSKVKEFSASSLVKDVPANVEKWGEEVFGVAADAVNFWMGDEKY